MDICYINIFTYSFLKHYQLEVSMKQRQISYWLKALCILLGIMGVFLFGTLTAYAAQMLNEDLSNPLVFFILFSWYTAILCYGVLILFWQVCTQIGNDNSFSMENVLAFRRMGYLGIAYMAGDITRYIWLICIHSASVRATLASIFMLLVALIFVVLCESLSQLVKGAYEMKQENDLTI